MTFVVNAPLHVTLLWTNNSFFCALLARHLCANLATLIGFPVLVYLPIATCWLLRLLENILQHDVVRFSLSIAQLV
jgi:hypothetical protein